MNIARRTDKGKSHFKMQKKHDNLFLLSILILPIIQFIIFYIGVNINSILLAFQKYDGEDFYFVGGENFVKFLTDIVSNPSMSERMRNTFVQFGLSFFVCFPLSILISYGIWRGVPLAGGFKIILFLPQIISRIVFVILFRLILEDLIPHEFPGSDTMTLLQGDNQFITILLFTAWISIAGNMVLYLGAMSSIDSSVVEYGRIDGLNPFGEFIHIVVPAIWPTVVVFTLTQIAAFFTSYGDLYNFNAGSTQDKYQTIGYYFFVIVVGQSSEVNYPYASAAGLIFTVVACAFTLLIKYLMEKFGPSED